MEWVHLILDKESRRPLLSTPANFLGPYITLNFLILLRLREEVPMIDPLHMSLELLHLPSNRATILLTEILAQINYGLG